MRSKGETVPAKWREAEGLGTGELTVRAVVDYRDAGDHVGEGDHELGVSRGGCVCKRDRHTRELLQANIGLMDFPGDIRRIAGGCDETQAYRHHGAEHGAMPQCTDRARRESRWGARWNWVWDIHLAPILVVRVTVADWSGLLLILARQFSLTKGVRV